MLDEDDGMRTRSPRFGRGGRGRYQSFPLFREEAQREIAQRRQDATGIETQPDLGLAGPVERRTTPAPDMVAGTAVQAPRGGSPA